MTFSYGSWSAPAGYDTKVNLLSDFAQGRDYGLGIKNEQDAQKTLSSLGASLDAPAADGSPPDLAQYGLPSRDVLLPMLQNPTTREQAIGLIKQATDARAQANDPLRKLQIAKAQFDVAHQGDPAPGPGPTAEMRNFQFAQDNPGFADFVGKNGVDKAPAAVQEYMWYRQNEIDAGRQPLSYMDFRSSGKSGFSVQTNPDGTVSVTQGPGATKPLTEGQSKDVGFLSRGAAALPLIDQYGDALTSLPQDVAGKTPLIGNFMKSPEYQQAQQAGDDFLNVILRKDSGAAIPDTERASYGGVYLPRPGDSPAVLEQKKAARGRALEGIKLGLPPQAILNMEKSGVDLTGATGAKPPASPPPPSYDGDPSLWQYMTPEQRALWQ